MNKDFVSSNDISPDEIQKVFSLSARLKKNRLLYKNLISNKTIIMIFDKPSTRTKISFFVGIKELGGEVVSLNSSELQIGRGETIEDTARTLSRYAHGIIIRTFEQKTVELLAKNFRYPVINALTNHEHPCQAISDAFTIYEKFGNFNLKLSFLGDFNNVAYSLFIILAKLKIKELCFSGPEKMFDKDFENKIKTISEGKTNFYYENDPKKAVKSADIIYTDVWVSMGFEDKEKDKESKMYPYQVNSELISLTGKNTLFMHCLPAKRGKEVSDDVIDSSASIVFDQAENRLHTQKALMVLLYKDKDF
ncbi:MAG: ornithine carbamoyltransferase [Spirochaetia bacterium]|nr:ornithine carbamoyltransferase [Spirochaetota bacterium]MCX8096937.1 ornithine carbamoyltransferase [Spirochaetota bacterium]MDW8112422.1 ornithine carbamoyltransferase [Spirochaetia bacterium]